MMNRTILIATFLFATLYRYELKAAHIIGGDVTYKCISTNTASESTRFQITFTMYRDPFGGGAQFDTGAGFGLFKSVESGTWEHVQTYTTNPTNIANVPFDLNCVVLPPNLGVQKAIYTFQVDIPWSNDTYQIVYQRCCRNASINNITNPGETGAAFYVELSSEAVRNCNNSPVFKNFPPVLICNGRSLVFNHSATDDEGDELVYEFCTPLSAGGTAGLMGGNPEACNGVRPNPDICPPPYAEIEYLAGVYSGTNPMGGNPQVSINNSTGIITGTPNLNGQFVVGVCVKEYRNGVLIGTIRRDFQFNVTECEGISEDIVATFCEGDSVVVNDSIYNQTGNYVQLLQTSGGCDSTLNIEVIKALNNAGSLTYNLCEGDSVSVNNRLYTSSGTYIQNLKTKAGCDSTLSVVVNIFEDTETLLNYSLCGEGVVVVNNETYTQEGQYIQNLFSGIGCDSTLIINVSGCSKTFGYDFELCDATTPSNSMNYAEFTPIYSGSSTCGDINATNIYRKLPAMNKHSCTEGRNGTVAMCVSSNSSCNIDNPTSTPITFEFTMNPENGFDLGFNKIAFHQKAPANYAWIAGNSGINNYPTKFSIKIFKENVEIFNQADLSTSLDWKEEIFDFASDVKFVAAQSTTFRVELLPYCEVGNGAQVSAWDIDDVEVFTTCINNGNRSVSGKIELVIPFNSKAEVRAYGDNHFTKTNVNVDGSFILNHLKADQSYKIEAYLNEDTKNGLNTLDLIKIQHHILGISSFQNVKQYHAADINLDNKITANDLVELRKVILTLLTEFTKNTSYRFLNKQEFDTLSDPWKVTSHYTLEPSFENVSNLRFVAVKVGDIE